MAFEKSIFNSQNSQKDLIKDDDYLIQKKMTLNAFLDKNQTQEFNPAETRDSIEPKQAFENIEKKAKELFEKSLFDGVIRILAPLHAKGLGTSSTYCLLASSYHQQNLFKNALDAYKKALEIMPSHVESLINLSLLRLDLGDYERGFMVFKRADDQKKLNQEKHWREYISKQHVKSAHAYYDRGYYHEALLEFLKASPDPKYPIPLNIHLQMIRCLWHLDRKNEAIQKLISLRKSYPTAFEISLLLGQFYFQAQKITLAIHEWERVLKLDPKNEKAIKYLSKVQYIQSMKESSLA